MSLQIWLPLDGDLNNCGLNPISVINNGATVNASGKIGSCYSFNGSSNYLKFNYSASNFIKENSISFWVKLTNVSGNKCICSSRKGVGYGFSIFFIGNKLRQDNCLDNNANYQTTFNYTFSANVWYHLSIVQTSTQKLLYINGILNQTVNAAAPTSNTATRMLIGASAQNDTANPDGNYLNGYLNDFRLYNHALSQKEVKEIAKGLVLHIPFKDNGTVPYNQNLLPDSNVNSLNKFLGTQARYYENTSQTSYTCAWETIADPPVPGIVYGVRQTVIQEQGFHSVTWYSSGTISVSAVPYTMSVYVKRISGTDLIFKFQYGKSPYVASTVILANDDEWHQYSWTFTPNTASGQAAASGTTRIYCGGLYSVGEVLICGWKLEKGTVATPWNEYGNTFYDCSGNGHNGMAMGALTALTTSPRFGKGIKFDNVNKHIIIPDFPTTGFGDSYSFAWWGTRSAQNVMYWGFGNGIKLNGMYNGIYWNTGDGSENPLYKPGTTTAVTAPALNTWTHWVMTGDGTKCRVYQNGVLWAEAKTYKSISGNLLFINGWNSLANYSSNNLSIADFRIYATALSAEDVKELYQTSASIDHNGNIYAREFDNINSSNKFQINHRGQMLPVDQFIEREDQLASIANNDDVLGGYFYEY